MVLEYKVICELGAEPSVKIYRPMHVRHMSDDLQANYVNIAHLL